MAGTYTKLPISDADRRRLVAIVRARSTTQHIAKKAQALLWLGEGRQMGLIVADLRVSRQSISEWRSRYIESGLDPVLTIQVGRGRKPTYSAEKVVAIVEATLHTTPEDATHWSCRSMSRAQGVSPATVQRIWDTHNIQPHRVETFKLSNDKQFVEKLTDVVGLYLDPPDKAIVLCVDEKSQIQALDRTQPGLPMKRGRCGTMTHDYKRNGTTTLFAALNVLDGKVTAECLPRHRHQEFLRFLRRLDREYSKRLDLHLIVDNYGTHKHPKVMAWLEKHPRFILHFTPTSSSWLNLIERWFRDLTDKRIRRGVFQSVPDLIEVIHKYVETNNTDPLPFMWTASVESIMAKITKCKDIYETLH